MQEMWEQTLRLVKSRISAEAYDNWFNGYIEAGGFDDDAGELTLRVPNRFHMDWLVEHYEDTILDCGRKATEANDVPMMSVAWLIDPKLQERVQRTEEPTAPLPRQSTPPPMMNDGLPHPAPVADLNPKYSFDRFVVGPSNQLAHAASVAVASSPGTRYNPLFIYGGVGLGKTHLVNAIGHTILKNNPDARILYLSAERFTNEFIWSLQNHRIAQFRERYRNACDVLLMDDIQFLAGREQTQEEFFHTFNALHHANKQIVVTSDVYPQQIARMEERLISRFQSGMVADVQAPEVDTRVAILQTKAQTEGIELGLDVAHFLAQVVKSNVRELEGTLTRLAAKAELLGRSIDLDLAKEMTRTMLPQMEKVTSVEDVQRAVCQYFGIRVADLKGKKRSRNISFPRMVAMYLCRERLGTSYPDIGDRFGGKDHTTAMHAWRKIGKMLEENDEKVLGAIAAVERQLGI